MFSCFPNMSTTRISILLGGRGVTDHFVWVNELGMFDVIFESELVSILETEKLET